MFFLKILILIVVLLVSLIISLVSLPGLLQYIRGRYYTRSYQPEEISLDNIGSFPDTYRIKNIPWVSYEKIPCEAAGLEMILNKYGMQYSIDYINFLMSFTYGATYNFFIDEFFPYTEPIADSRLAAPYLGLKMRFLTAREPDLFIRALKYYLSQGYPALVYLNGSSLYDEEGLNGHVELVVGYDQGGFYYYETGEKDRFKKEEEGLKVSNKVLLKAVAELNQTMMKPWVYGFSIFMKEEGDKDIDRVFEQIGKNLVGKSHKTVSQGSRAIFQFALDISNQENYYPVDKIETLYYTRWENARFLMKKFQDNLNVYKGARLLKEASHKYKEACQLSDDFEEREKIAELLMEGAMLEREAGQVFLELN